jgi:hypothetical protein
MSGSRCAPEGAVRSGVFVADQEVNQVCAVALAVLAALGPDVALAAAQFSDHLAGGCLTLLKPGQVAVLRGHAAGLSGVNELVDVHGSGSGCVRRTSQRM